MGSRILIINGGSSSLKSALFECSNPAKRLHTANLTGIGTSNASMSVSSEGEVGRSKSVKTPDHGAALDAVLGALMGIADDVEIVGVGHRVVHGGPKFFRPQRIDAQLVEELKSLEPFDPEHLPAQVELVERLTTRIPNGVQVACFDTAFHHDLPPVAKRLAIPRKFDSIGVRRYGFHGLSYTYLMGALEQLDPAAAKGRVVLAHLGNGASLAAVKEGKSFDTSMALTPASGIPMGTRSGDLDPGLASYLSKSQGMTLDEFNRMVHLESGLLGISETSMNVHSLLESEPSDPRAAEALACFCYGVKKYIGAYAAAMGGLDSIVFSGGIGENSAEIRARICGGLEFLGVELSDHQNRNHAPLISSGSCNVSIRVISTDEEQVIADSVLSFLPQSAGTKLH